MRRSLELKSPCSRGQVLFHSEDLAGQSRLRAPFRWRPTLVTEITLMGDSTSGQTQPASLVSGSSLGTTSSSFGIPACSG